MASFPSSTVFSDIIRDVHSVYEQKLDFVYKNSITRSLKVDLTLLRALLLPWSVSLEVWGRGMQVEYVWHNREPQPHMVRVLGSSCGDVKNRIFSMEKIVCSNIYMHKCRKKSELSIRISISYFCYLSAN